MNSRSRKIAQINMDPIPETQNQETQHRRRPSIDRTSRSSSRKPSLDQSSLDTHILAPINRAHRTLSVNSQDLDKREDKDVVLNRWQEAAGNLEDARLSFDVISNAISDAIYLDETAFNQMTPVMHFTETIKAQERRILALESELKATRTKLEESNEIQREALRRHADLQQENENNSVVFKMHYEELLRRDKEISRLKDVIEVLNTKD